MPAVGEVGSLPPAHLSGGEVGSAEDAEGAVGLTLHTQPARKKRTWLANREQRGRVADVMLVPPSSRLPLIFRPLREEVYRGACQATAGDKDTRLR